MKDIKIVDYTPFYAQAFKAINQQWIEQYFVMEEADHKALDHPQEYIIDKGGYIVMALCDNKPVGACALIKLHNFKYDYELAKMGILPEYRGLKIGWKLGQAVLEKARSIGAESLYLESNRKLTPALTLYGKLGFEEVFGLETPYERSDIQMAMML